MERLHHPDEHKVQPIAEDTADAEPAKHQVNGSQLASLSIGRKRLLLAIFCFAQFLDTFNNSALFASIPPISQALGISNANSVWLLSAYQLTFAALLLTVRHFQLLVSPRLCSEYLEQSGRLSDVYNASMFAAPEVYDAI